MSYLTLIGKEKFMGFAFEDLLVYQRALEFSVSIIDMIDRVETSRRHYRLIEQLEASSTSIAMNIAEGKGRYSKKEFKHFLFIARGSLYETITMLQILMKKNSKIYIANLKKSTKCFRA